MIKKIETSIFELAGEFRNQAKAVRVCLTKEELLSLPLDAQGNTTGIGNEKRQTAIRQGNKIYVDLKFLNDDDAESVIWAHELAHGLIDPSITDSRLHHEKVRDLVLDIFLFKEGELTSEQLLLNVKSNSVVLTGSRTFDGAEGAAMKVEKHKHSENDLPGDPPRNLGRHPYTMWLLEAKLNDFGLNEDPSILEPKCNDSEAMKEFSAAKIEGFPVFSVCEHERFPYLENLARHEALGECRKQKGRDCKITWVGTRYNLGRCDVKVTATGCF